MASSGERQASCDRSMSNLKRKLCGWVRQHALKMQGPGPLTIKPFSQRTLRYSTPENTSELWNANPVLKRGGQ